MRWLRGPWDLTGRSKGGLGSGWMLRDTGGGGGASLITSATTSVIADLKTQTYTVDGVSATVASVIGSDVPRGYVFDPGQLTANGYEHTNSGTEGFILQNAAASLLGSSSGFVLLTTVKHAAAGSPIWFCDITGATNVFAHGVTLKLDPDGTDPTHSTLQVLEFSPGSTNHSVAGLAAGTARKIGLRLTAAEGAIANAGSAVFTFTPDAANAPGAGVTDRAYLYAGVGAVTERIEIYAASVYTAAQLQALTT